MTANTTMPGLERRGSFERAQTAPLNLGGGFPGQFGAAPSPDMSPNQTELPLLVCSECLGARSRDLYNKTRRS